jgi:hypothetical protein
MLKLGLLTKRTRITDAVWAAIGRVSPLAQVALLAKYGAKAREDLTLGDLRGAS